MTPTLPELLAGMRTVIEKATPGPWRPGYCASLDPGFYVCLQGGNFDVVARIETKISECEANAVFVAAARTQWPATVKALKIAVDALEFARTDLPCTPTCDPPGAARQYHGPDCPHLVREGQIEALSQIESILRAAK